MWSLSADIYFTVFEEQFIYFIILPSPTHLDILWSLPYYNKPDPSLDDCPPGLHG